MNRWTEGIVVVAVWTVLAAGCNEPFSPRGPYTDNLVVYGVLTNRSDTQYVRVYSTYNPPSVNPLTNTSDNAQAGANVTIADDSGTFHFSQGTTTRLDKSRY